MKATSQFTKWFKAQFGNLPDFNKRQKLREKRSRLQRELFSVERQLRHEERLDREFSVALKTRNAAEGRFEF